ncbi:MAG: DNA primase [Betaproteobacteria bacterium]|nr:DNA primase [Betaproteobacteria bacterium]
MIPDSFKQDLLNRVDIVDVISRYVQLKKGGANFLGLCPFHNEKTPSFTVSPAKQFYHCFGCGVHGNAVGFLMAYSTLGYIDAVKELAASVGMQVPDERPPTPEQAARKERETDLYGLMDKAMDFYRGELKKSPRAIAYLKGRGLTGEIAARFRIGYAPDDWQGLKGAFAQYEDAALVEAGLVIQNEGKRYDRFRDRVMFPIFNVRGAVIGFGGRVIGEGEPKYLNSPETPLFEKGRELYGLLHARDAIRTAGHVLVVEGYMDVVALAQHEVGNAVATLGTATTPVHVGKLLRTADEIVFCFDGDAAGRKAAWRALEVSLPLAPDHKPIRFLCLPDGEDPDTYVRKHGKEGWQRKLREAETLSQFLLSQLRAECDLETPEGRARFVSVAKPHVQKITAPQLRLQIANAVAELARLPQGAGIPSLLELPARDRRFSRPPPARTSYAAPRSPEYRLLYSLLLDLSLAEHVDDDLLLRNLPESGAVIAVRDACREFETEPSVGLLVDRLQGGPWLDLILGAHKYGEELAFEPEEASYEFQQALVNLDLARRKRELDHLREGGLRSKEERIAFQEKNLDRKKIEDGLRLQAPVAGTSKPLSGQL